MTLKGKWPGTWAVICDVCGFRFPSDQLSKRWDGLMVCKSDWEHRHPQDLIKIRAEKIAPPYVRPDNTDLSQSPVCTENTRQGIADIGTADCAQTEFVSKATY